jgi:hypothetical protein
MCEPEDAAPFWCPFCEIPGCINGICLGKGDERFCWPHSGSGTTVKAMIEDMRHSGIGIVRVDPDGVVTRVAPEEFFL